MIRHRGLTRDDHDIMAEQLRQIGVLLDAIGHRAIPVLGRPIDLAICTLRQRLADDLQWPLQFVWRDVGDPYDRLGASSLHPLTPEGDADAPQPHRAVPGKTPRREEVDHHG